MNDSRIKKIMAVVLGICIVVLIVWNVMESELQIGGINN